MENHSKYNELIYTQQNGSLYLNLFIASELNWKDKGIKIRQETNFPFEEQTKLIITEGSSRFKLWIRQPSWVANGAFKILVNGKEIPLASQSSSYLVVERSWKKGDIVQISLPMHNTIEHLPNVPEYIAIMHGPILLGAKTGTEDLKGLVADDSRWGHIPSGKRLPVDKAPILIEDDISTITKSLEPIKGNPLNFSFANVKMINPEKVMLEPFYQIHDARYMMYWMVLSKTQYSSYVDSIANAEKEKLTLQKRTIDFVASGEQQPEADHLIQSSNSNTGNNLNEFWRDARNGGYFSYNLSTNKETEMSLIVRYWGAEWGNRKFDIYIDDEKLVTENNTNKWNRSRFQNVEYSIPASMLAGKENIRVKFQAAKGNTAGAVYYIRLVQKFH